VQGAAAAPLRASLQRPSCQYLKSGRGGRPLGPAFLCRSTSCGKSMVPKTNSVSGMLLPYCCSACRRAAVGRRLRQQRGQTDSHSCCAVTQRLGRCPGRQAACPASWMTPRPHAPPLLPSYLNDLEVHDEVAALVGQQHGDVDGRRHVRLARAEGDGRPRVHVIRVRAGVVLYALQDVLLADAPAIPGQQVLRGAAHSLSDRGPSGWHGDGAWPHLLDVGVQLAIGLACGRHSCLCNLCAAAPPGEHHEEEGAHTHTRSAAGAAAPHEHDRWIDRC
jgi:hypothetical protein